MGVVELKAFRKKAIKCHYCQTLQLDTSFRCTSCLQWDPFKRAKDAEDDGTVRFDDIKEKDVPRRLTGIMDKNYAPSEPGGPPGIPVDSVTLLAGKNGGGKSTIVIQAADAICTATGRECLFILTEEGGAQVKARVKRLPLQSRHLFRFSLKDSETDIPAVIAKRKPCLAVVDSLDGMSGRSAEEAANLLKAFKSLADKHDCPFIVINHINKDDEFAGEESLQHWVDITMTLFPTGEGAGDTGRELFTLKNRYGEAQIGTQLTMTATGLVSSLDPLVQSTGPKNEPRNDSGEEEEEEEEEGEDDGHDGANGSAGTDEEEDGEEDGEGDSL